MGKYYCVILYIYNYSIEQKLFIHMNITQTYTLLAYFSFLPAKLYMLNFPRKQKVGFVQKAKFHKILEEELENFHSQTTT